MKLLLVLPVVILAATGAAEAQAGEASAGWSWTVSPYFLAPNMTGTAGVRGLEVDVDADPGDIFDRLQFGAMMYVEARKGPWAISLDGTYMDLSQDAKELPLTVGMQQGGVAVTVYRHVTPWAEVLIKGTFNILSASLEGSGPLGIDESDDKSWFDPGLGVRLSVPDAGKWDLSLQGDIGGFGVGSDFAWQIYPIVGYRFSDLFELAGSYRAISMDYSSGEGSDEFIYDLTTFGPQLGLLFHF
jgi:hypothetical protein